MNITAPKLKISDSTTALCMHLSSAHFPISQLITFPVSLFSTTNARLPPINYADYILALANVAPLLKLQSKVRFTADSSRRFWLFHSFIVQNSLRTIFALSLSLPSFIGPNGFVVGNFPHEYRWFTYCSRAQYSESPTVCVFFPSFAWLHPHNDERARGSCAWHIALCLFRHFRQYKMRNGSKIKRDRLNWISVPFSHACVRPDSRRSGFVLVAPNETWRSITNGMKMPENGCAAFRSRRCSPPKNINKTLETNEKRRNQRN